VSKLLVLASGVVKDPGGALRAVSAYVVLSAGPASRVFRVHGDAAAPLVEELEAATTIDPRRFRGQVQSDLQPDLEAVRMRGHPAHVDQANTDWVCGFVRAYLKTTEGRDVV
jgi:hypothetical protein